MATSDDLTAARPANQAREVAAGENHGVNASQDADSEPDTLLAVEGDVLLLSDLTPDDQLPPEPMVLPWWASAVAFVVVAAVLWPYVNLPSFLADTHPTGGDVAGHVWFPNQLRHLLPHLSGWADDWYAGFPSGAMYFPVPALLTLLLDLLLPYGIAMKVSIVSGFVLLPAGAWFLTRRLKLHAMFPPAAAFATLAFQTEEFHTIYGGNIASVFAGMFSLSLGFALALFAAGALVPYLNGDVPRVSKWLPLLLAASTMSHLLAGVFAAVLCSCLLLSYPSRRAHVRGLLLPVGSGMLISAVWAVPFLLGSSYATDMGYEQTRAWSKLLPVLWKDAPATTWWYWLVLPLAVMGLVWAVASRHRGMLALVAMTLSFGAMYMTWPTTYVWDARWLPYWWWGLWLLAASALVQAAALFSLRSVYPAVALMLLVAVPALSMSGWIPKLPGAPAADRPVAASWGSWDLEGYERREKWPEYKAVMDTMRGLSKQHGCGRALWEYDSTQGSYGSPMAMMLLPYWTDGCVDSVEGLFMEGSQTTPFHFMVQYAVSKDGSGPVRDMPYRAFDLDWGVPAMRTLGVRWYMTFMPESAQAAEARDDLALLATSGPWKIFEVKGSAPVSSLDVMPKVVSDANWPVAYAQAFDADPSGGVIAGPLPAPFDAGDPLPEVAVSEITTGDDGSVSFRVSRTGVPVVVHSSWYPGWKVDGASSPVRYAANMMALVPTKEVVRMTPPVPRGRTAGELAFLAGAGLYGWWLLRRRRPATPSDPADLLAEDEAAVGSVDDVAFDADAAGLTEPDQVVPAATGSPDEARGAPQPDLPDTADPR